MSKMREMDKKRGFEDSGTIGGVEGWGMHLSNERCKITEVGGKVKSTCPN
jgi:hypothetical protein